MGKRKVVVVGAGAAGLACADAFSRKGLSVKVFEAHSAIGGTWSLSQEDSQLYDGLRTNLPTKLMQFSDVPFDSDVPSFVGSQAMENYLVKFVNEKSLWRYIQVRTLVQKVTPRQNGNVFDVVAIHGGKEMKETCDAVVVCNGHFNKRFIPKKFRDECASFKGNVIHSKDYRIPEFFRGQIVLVVGAQSSGTDIGRELDGIAKEVHICDSRKSEDAPYAIPTTKTAFWRPKLKKIIENSNEVEFEDGERMQVDAIIFCTGYEFDFPFLPSGLLQLGKDGKRVRPIWKEIMHAALPNLFFVGLNQPIVPFPFFEIQARSIAEFLAHPERVPSAGERWADVKRIDQLVAQGKVRDSKTHVLEDQWLYLLDIAGRAGLEDVKEMKERLDRSREMYLKLGKLRPSMPAADDSYRNAHF